MVRFGSCAVDIATRTVLRDDVEQHLEPQAFDLLAFLLSHRDRVIPKPELLDGVWGDQFVSESALTTRIKEVRQALGDDGTRQAIIKNFRGRGYRFVAAIIDDDEQTDSSTDRRRASGSNGLVGRDNDMQHVSDQLGSGGLMTLVGPGGVGKTSLAIETARSCREDRADGVRVVHLAPVRDVHSVVHALRRDIGLIDVGEDERALIEAIADLDAIIVIDNCEHLLPEVSRIVDAILRADGDVSLLATSRERLGVSRERVWPVAPLDDEAARQLLLERSQAVRPGYQWVEEEEASIARLLATLDRLPLAIEMAAARLPSIGAVDLASLLGDRLDLLRSADRTADDRHQTVRSLVSWSENLLDDDERDLLSTMTVFADAVAADDITSVAGVDQAELVVGPLAGLVDKSLIVADADEQPTKYRLLETVRTIAAPRRFASVESRHAHHIADVVTHSNLILRTPGEPAAARRLDGLVAEIRVAHQWARTHEPGLAAELTAALLVYAHERQWTEPATWAAALLAGHDEQDPITLSASASVAADASNRGDYELGMRHARRAASSDDHRVVFSAHDTLINLGLYTGDLDDTIQSGSLLIALGDRIGDSAVRIAGAMSIVLTHVYSRQLDEAMETLDLLDSNLPLSSTSESWRAYTRGEVFAACERPAEALEHFDRAIRLGSSVGSHLVVSVAQVSGLAVRARTGDVDEAMAEFGPVLSQYKRTRSFTHAITGLRNLIELLVRAGRDEPAMVLLGALTSPGVKATYGTEADHLDEARDKAMQRLSPAVVSSLIERGSSHHVTWAIDYATTVLATGENDAMTPST